MGFRSGFVNIIGRPNVGKSTLLNALTGEKLAIITPKAQTTRRRILGIVNTPGYQIIYSDTPGLIDDPEYKLHHWMNAQVSTALQDADVILFMTDTRDELQEQHRLVHILRETTVPVLVVINKADLLDNTALATITQQWQSMLPGKPLFVISALQGKGVAELQHAIRECLPEHPAYYDTDDYTDQTERAITSEIIREKIFLQYQQEIPYNCEVIVDAFKDKGDIIAINGVIYVGRDTHKSIIIGKGGAAIKQLGIAARQDIEAFTGKKIFLQLFVKVKENWKNDERSLKHFGYEN